MSEQNMSSEVPIPRDFLQNPHPETDLSFTSRKRVNQIVGGIIETNPNSHMSSDIQGTYLALKEAGLEVGPDLDLDEYIDIFMGVFGETIGINEGNHHEFQQRYMDSIRSLLQSENEKINLKIDPLTQVENRAAYRDFVEEMINNPPSQYAICVIDIDGMKDINDTFGHGAGDIYLTTTAGMLKSSLRDRDRIFRIGGDEFLIFVENVDVNDDQINQKSGMTASQSIEHRIRSTVATFKASVDGEKEISHTPKYSFGIASPLENEDYDRLFNRADQQMYRQKAERKSQ